MYFLDVKTDFAFKKVFGSEESKDVLISFLNALLDFPAGQQVIDLNIVDPYQIPLLKGMKDTYVDVKAKLSDGRQVIIEMQVLNVPGFEKRILYNAAKSYSAQLQKGDDYTLLNPVIALTIVDFTLFEDLDPVINCFKLLEKEEFIAYNDDVELIFVELPKFEKDEHELESIMDKWIYFVQNAGSLECVPKTLESDAEICKAFDIANTAGMRDDELEAQRKRQDLLLAQRTAATYANEKGVEKGRKEGREEGREEGRKEGREEGREENKHEVAKNMLAKNMEAALIIELTGLSTAELEALKNDQ
ncbi:MAG: Rpn family recombination-promoting nuclease/putative transposase [Gammaproteobacteria bacterium]|nr:Rpn family recombination-promoting nuclease/putative transposase [Gammaproteobacteria bacterium]